MNKGIVLALSAYMFWGMFPIYWRLLKHVPSDEIVAERVVWSLFFFVIVLVANGKWRGLKSKITSSKNKYQLVLPAVLLGGNWLVYIWAVTGDYVLETSLGYFIAPLSSVFLGVFFLRESLRRLQWVAVSIAGLGVLLMTFLYGQFPWVALFLAASWSIYGLLRKQSPLNPIEGLTLEMLLLFLPAVIYLVVLSSKNLNHFFYDPITTILFVVGGVVSGLPLIIFIAGARLIKLSLIGILQFIYPTIVFFLGVFLYDEPFNQARVVGFSFIWIALIIFTLEGSYYAKSKKLNKFKG